MIVELMKKAYPLLNKAVSFILIAIVFVMAYISIGFVGMTLGCKTFEPTVWEDKLPPECNMSLNTYKLYYNTSDKSATVPSSDFCFKVLQKLRCQEEVYGLDNNGKLNPVDYNNPGKYRDYVQCKEEIK